MVLVSGTHSTRAEGNLSRGGPQLDGENGAGSGWVDFAADRFASASASSGRELHLSRRWADKEGRQW